jgi:hypothetical protein
MKLNLRSLNTSGFLAFNHLGWAAAIAIMALIADLQGQTLTLTNIWGIPAGVRDYLGSANNERGVAINPVTTHVILVSKTLTPPTVAILDSDTGAELGFVDASSIDSSKPGTFKLSKIGVAGDGAIYGANLTTASSTTPFVIYRWAGETDTAPAVAYSGDPGYGGAPRWGDSFDVRGAGTNTQILASGSTGNPYAAIFTTLDGTNFIANRITTGLAATELSKGLAFGSNNTFYVKNSGTTVARHLSFDLVTSNAVILATFTLDSTMIAISIDITNQLLAGVLDNNTTANSGHHLKVYDISNPASPTSVGDFVYSLNADGANSGNANLAAAVDLGAGKIIGLDCNNGLLAVKIEFVSIALPPMIVSQPQDQSVVQGGYVTLKAGASGTKPLSYQWRFNATNSISGATNSELTLTNVQLADAGVYALTVSNVAGTTNSTDATLTVTPAVFSSALAPAWRLSPGSRPYLSVDNTQRGMAYNSATTNLLLVTRSPKIAIYVLDARTGTDLRQLTVDPAVVSGSNPAGFDLNMIGVADDGVVFAGNLTTGGGGYKLYRWDNDTSNAVPTLVFEGDPGGSQRWGDTMDVRGAGTNTQVLLGARDGGSVTILTTSDGTTFAPTSISVADSTGDAVRLGLAFGAGNSYWTKMSGGLLRHVEYDLAAATGTSVQTFSAADLGASILPIGVEPNRKLLAGIALETPDTVRLYDLSTLTSPPIMLDTEFFQTDNVNGNGTGSLDFGGDMLFALDSNNGIVAFQLLSTESPVISIRRDNTLTISWAPTGGTLQSTPALTGASTVWNNVGTANPTVVTVGTGALFFRVKNP